MSIERRGRFWHYEFWIEGVRHRGTTKQTSKTLAREFEHAERTRISLGDVAAPPPPVTLAEASIEWWTNRGQYKRSKATLKWRMKALRRLIDFNLALCDIDTPDVERAMAKRRGEMTHNKRMTSASSVNRDVIDTLRPILNYARKIMKVKSLPEIDWKALRLPEPKERVREFSAVEITALRKRLPVHHRAVFDFISTFGVRLNEAWFPLDCMDLEGKRVSLRKRKGGDWHTIPINDTWKRELAVRAGRARAAGIDTVWFWEDRKGKLHRLAPGSFQSYMRDVLIELKIKDARPAHDLRHHAATQYVRRTGSLAGAKRLLGHENIATTARYAHASEDDVRSGLFGETPQESPQTSDEGKKHA